MNNDTTDKKVDNNLSDGELMNVTGGSTNCLGYNHPADCNSDTECTWNSKTNQCYLQSNDQLFI